MKAKKKKSAPKTQKFSFILAVCLLLVAGYFIISLINTQMEIKERKDEIEQLDAQYQQQIAENESLQNVIDNDDRDSYIERVAREKLGYVMPGEKVYYNVTPNN